MVSPQRAITSPLPHAHVRRWNLLAPFSAKRATVFLFAAPVQSRPSRGPHRVPHPTKAMLCSWAILLCKYGAASCFTLLGQIFSFAQYAQILQTYGGGNRVA